MAGQRRRWWTLNMRSNATRVTLVSHCRSSLLPWCSLLATGYCMRVFVFVCLCAHEYPRVAARMNCIYIWLVHLLFVSFLLCSMFILLRSSFGIQSHWSDCETLIYWWTQPARLKCRFVNDNECGTSLHCVYVCVYTVFASGNCQ